MPHLITSIDPASPAERAGLRAGDVLTHIDGEIVIDSLDVQALAAGKKPVLRVKREGELLDIPVRKGEYAALGLNFDSPLMSGLRLCCNHCLFCFVDQLPENVRPSMRVKDDDWRMSLMTGSYVTLTNVSDAELNRIVRRHASPLYISIHATNAELRSHILGTPRAARLAHQLKVLSDGGIKFHCQCVLCPDLNDGDALEETIQTLLTYSGALSLALVPVGLTDHREGLTPLHKYTPEQARAVLAQARRWQSKLLRERGTRFVFPSDEFYIAAGEPLPSDEEYEGYDQIDDGVGLLRLFESEFADACAEAAPRTFESPKRVLFACGVSASGFMRRMFREHPVPGIEIEVVPVENGFFGKSVTVSGLITGSDLIRTLSGMPCDCVMITSRMLRDGEDIFLDDMTLAQVRQTLGKPVLPFGRSGYDLYDALTSL